MAHCTHYKKVDRKNGCCETKKYPNKAEADEVYTARHQKDKDVIKSEMPPVTEVANMDVVTTEGVALEERAAIMPIVKAEKGLEGGLDVV